MRKIRGRTAATAFPWQRPQRELLVLLLIGIACLTPVYPISTQDVSRLCLTEAILAGRLTIDSCVGHGLDRARFDGQIYSDKAPGMALLALPAVALTRLPSPAQWHYIRDARLWIVRIATSGTAFMLLVFLLGRVAEGLVPGAGPPVAVTFALGTLGGGLAATTFDQATAAALGFAAFLLAWRGRPGWAGAVAGLACLVEYEAALVVAAVGAYVLAGGLRGALRYLVGALPGGILLAGYDWAAFGSPFHISYRYVANIYTRRQAQGLFGISLPHWHSVTATLTGDRGLLVVSPVLAAAAAGLVLLARAHRREAAVAIAATIAYLLLEFGYFLPYGGISPGPRFLLPALPLLALGLAPAFRYFRSATIALAIPSLVASTTVALTWTGLGTFGYRHTVWGELVRAVLGTHGRLRSELASNAFTWFGFSRLDCALVVAACTAAAFGIALRTRGREPLPRPIEVSPTPALESSG